MNYTPTHVSNVSNSKMLAKDSFGFKKNILPLMNPIYSSTSANGIVSIDK